MSARPRQRHAASSAASEASDDDSSSTAKTAPAAAAAASAELSPEAAAAETQRALRFVIMLSVSILVAPLAAYFVTQHVFAFSAQIGAFAAVSAVNLIMLFTVCYAPKFASRA